VKLQHIFWLTILVHAAFASMRVAVSLFALHLGASALTVGIIMALIAFLPMLMSVHAGRAIDRIGPRRPMVLGAALIAAGLSLAAAVPRLETLFFVTPVTGVGFLLYHIAAHQAVGMLGEERTRTRNFSMLALAFSTSSFIGPMLAGFLIDLFGYRTTFVVSTLLGACAWAAALRLRGGDARSAAPISGRKPRAFDLLRTRELRTVLGVSGLLSICWDLFTFAIPIYGVRIGLSASEIGIILGAFGIAIFAVRLLIPIFAHRMQEWTLLIATMVVTAAAYVAIPLVTSTGLLMLLAFVAGFGLGAAQPMIMTLVYRAAPKGRAGEAVGIRTLFLNVSQTTVPLGSGAFGAALGMTPAFWLTAVLLAAASWYVRRR
jgi:predicted MFS family arabinose efflux permease